MWTNGRVDQAAVGSIESAFDKSTPSNPKSGIPDMDISAFGSPPDLDARTIILVCNIQDGFSGTGRVYCRILRPHKRTPRFKYDVQ